MRIGLTCPSVIAILILAAATPACSGSRGTGSVAPAPRRASLITREEIGQRTWSDVYEAVRTLRGNWLAQRGPDTIRGTDAEIQVRLNTYRLGGLAALRGMPIDNVRSIEFVSPSDATARWGLGYHRGAIVVWTLDR